MANEFDVVVIGAGTGGYVAAIRASQLGLKTAVVERQKALGGTCLIWGCIPTKALLEHAHALKVVQNVKDWGVTIGEGAVGIDMSQVQNRKDKIVTGLTKGIEFLFKKNKIDWIKGTASVTERGTVDVVEGDKQMLSASKEIIIATGSTPRSVPGVEIDRRRIITSDEAIALREVPKSMIVLGSGAVGVEFASIFRRFGSRVTLIELLPRIVPAEDEAISTELEKSFRKQGIVVHTGTKVTRASADANGVEIEAQLPGRCRKAHCRLSPRRHRARTGDAGTWRRTSRADPRSRLRDGRQPVPHGRSRVLGDRRCDHIRRLGPPRTRSSRTYRRPRASWRPSALPAETRSLSTSITFRRARIAILRSAALVSQSVRLRSEGTTCKSAPSRFLFWAARRWPARARDS